MRHRTAVAIAAVFYGLILSSPFILVLGWFL